MAFAFSIFDDTDNGTVENLTPVYLFLEELGLRTTKSVWPLDGGIGGGDSLEDPDYLAFVLDLKRRGFELALHNVQNGSAQRPRIELGLQRYHGLIGEAPRLHANHSRNRDNIYWGAQRFSHALPRAAYKLGSRGKELSFEGHVEGSPHFWGDLCRQQIRYVRNFAFDEIDLNRINPSMPYHDPRKPYVNYWFSSTDGADVERFCNMLSEPNQERLEANNGVCIMYTHFASGFVEQGKLHPRFKALMHRLAARPGRFLPVGELLDELLAQRGGKIPPAELRRMEWRWLREKLRKGRT